MFMKLYVAALVVAFTTGTSTAQESLNPRQRQMAERVRQEKGLPEAAALTGRYEGGEPIHQIDVAMDLTTLAFASDLIVVGRVTASRSLLSADRKHVITEYQVGIERTFDGDTAGQPVGAVAVSLPGGALVFSDGSAAETRAAGFEMMQAGRSYLLFLERIDDPAIAASRGRIGTYRPAMGSQGVFEVRDRYPLLKTAGHESAPVAQELAPVVSLNEAFERLALAVTQARLLKKERQPQ